MKCRHCASKLSTLLVDLGSAPPSNAYLTEEKLREPEVTYPLRVLVCEKCWLVQTEDFAKSDELFSGDYAYYSSFSTTWLKHAERYVSKMIERFHLDQNSHVVEIASNDGYLLQFVKSRGISCTGVEPTSGTVEAARRKGIETVEAFFGELEGIRLAGLGKRADLMTANNVLAHVPDINDFVAGFTALLKPEGVATFEFPHVLKLLEEYQFDTIYHEHYSYLSLNAVDRVLAANGLCIFDVESIPTHGGSLRVYAQHKASGRHRVSDSVGKLLKSEEDFGLLSHDAYNGFQARTESIKDELICFLIEAKRRGKCIAGYGAAAKGNTLMNFAGCRRDLISFVVDRNPSKQGKYMPGSRIPIVDEERFQHDQPDYIVIFPWNLKSEIVAQLAYTRSWGAQFVTAIPSLEIMS